MKKPKILKYGKVTVEEVGVTIKDFAIENGNSTDLMKLAIKWAIKRLKKASS